MMTSGIFCKCGAIVGVITSDRDRRTNVMIERLDLSESSRLLEIRDGLVFYQCKCGRRRTWRKPA